MKNKQLKVSVDCDGVLMKTSCAICELINLMTYRNYKFKDINSWDFWEKEGWSKQFWEAYNYFDRQGRLNIKPYDYYLFDALTDINSIIGGKFDIVTANNQDSAAHIEDWMLWNWYSMGYEMRYPKFEIKCLGRVTCKEKLSLGYDIYLDDNPNMAAEIVNFPEKQMILFNCPWNKHIKSNNQVTRVESWKEVPDLIKNTTKENDGWKETLHEIAAAKEKS